MERFRRHVINEILYTELNYINDLGVLEDVSITDNIIRLERH